MPKHIKALKCPQCGSTRATLIREDHYRCDSCSTEFFLDSDDITIHHKHETVPDNSNPFSFIQSQFSAHPKRSLLIAGGASFAFFLLVIIGNLTSSRSMDRVAERIAASQGGYGYTGTLKERMSYDLEPIELFASAAGRPVVGVCGSAYQMNTSSKNAQGFVRLYDGETKKVLKDIQLPDLKGSVDVTGLRQFGDGSVYLILNKKHLYRIDPSTLDMKEVHGEDYKVAEFSEGFATVEFVYRDNGDGLKVMTNLGKSFVYYPIPNKLYGEKMAYKGYLEKLPAPKVGTHFTFSRQTTDYEDQQIQLVRYRTLEQVGYPYDEPDFGWQKDYGGSGIFTDASPYRKVFVLPYTAERSRLQGYEDFTPGAYYFSPAVLHEAADRVLISFKPTAASDATRILRCLDAQTGKVLWSYSDEEDHFAYTLKTTRFSGGYVVASSSEAWVLTNDGKLKEGTNFHKVVEGED